jgi:hypothetical protein
VAEREPEAFKVGGRQKAVALLDASSPFGHRAIHFEVEEMAPLDLMSWLRT